MTDIAEEPRGNVCGSWVRAPRILGANRVGLNKMGAQSLGAWCCGLVLMAICWLGVERRHTAELRVELGAGGLRDGAYWKLRKDLMERAKVKRKLDSALSTYFGAAPQGRASFAHSQPDNRGRIHTDHSGQGGEAQQTWHPAKIVQTSGKPQIKVPAGWSPEHSTIPSSLREGYRAIEGEKPKMSQNDQPKWKDLKSWTPYNPFESVNKQRTTTGNTAIAKVWSGTSSGDPRQFQGSVVRSNGYVKDVGQHAGCQDWAVHPLGCIQSVYHGHLQGTKFSAIATKNKGQESHQDLNLERQAVAGEVASGLLSGAIKVKRHSALARKIQEARVRLAQKQESAEKGATAAGKSGSHSASRTKEDENTWKPTQHDSSSRQPSLAPSITPWYEKPYFTPAASPPRHLGGSTSSRVPHKATQSLKMDRRMNGVRFFSPTQSSGAEGDGGSGLKSAENAYAAGEREAKQFYAGYRDAKEYDAGMTAGQKFGKLAHGNSNSFVVLPLNPKDKGKAQFIPSLMDLAVAEKNKATMERRHWQQQRKIDAFQQEVAATKEKQAALQTEERAQKSIIKQLEETVKLEQHAPRFVTYVAAPAAATPAPQQSQKVPSHRQVLSPELAREAQTAEALAYNEGKAKLERQKLASDLKKLARDQARVHH